MTRQFAVILFELILLGTTLLLGEDRRSQLAQVTTTEHVSFGPGGVIHFSGSYGDLSVEGWDRPDVEITVIKSMPYDYQLKRPDKATKYLDALRIVTERKSRTELVISTILPARGGLLPPHLSRRLKAV